jgi:hypothetical protein
MLTLPAQLSSYTWMGQPELATRNGKNFTLDQENKTGYCFSRITAVLS